MTLTIVSGNHRGVKPYVSGASCSSCPGGYTCSDNLCVNGSDTSSGSGSGGSTTTDPGNENIPGEKNSAFILSHAET